MDKLKMLRFFLLGISLGVLITIASNKETPTEVKAEETIEHTETVYPICDVVDNYETETGTVLVCEMPNGELHEYKIEDAPEGKVELVCFRTDNQDDYTAYEVVAVR